MSATFYLDESALSRAVSDTYAVRRDECRFPIDTPDRDDFRLCRAPIARGSYCACHAALSYSGVTRVPVSVLAVVGSRQGRSH